MLKFPIGRGHLPSPAIAVIKIQCLSIVVTVLILYLSWNVFQYRLTIYHAFACQILCALTLTRWIDLPWWWSVIQVTFPVALVLLLKFEVAPTTWLILFVVTLLWYWSTYRTQVPYYPSTLRVWQSVQTLIPEDKSIHFVDIGSGLGGLILFLSRKFPLSQFLGVEIAPFPWLISRLRLGKEENASFARYDYESLHFSQFDIVFAYLSPAAMEALWIKAKNEMKPGSILISYEFSVPGVPENLSIYPVKEGVSPTPGAPKLYIWHL